VADTSQSDNDIEDDVSLHAVALQSLRSLALLPKAEREGSSLAKPREDIDESHGLRVEEELLSAPAGEILRRQAERLTLLLQSK
jgi:hypothetical protein